MDWTLELGASYIIRIGPPEYPIFYRAHLIGRTITPRFYVFKAYEPEERVFSVHDSTIYPDTEENRKICLKIAKTAKDGTVKGMPKR